MEFQINDNVMSEILLLNSIDPKSNVSGGDYIKEEVAPAELNAHELEVTCNQSVEMQIKSEALDPESYNELYLKQELLHEELGIKPDSISPLHSENLIPEIEVTCNQSVEMQIKSEVFDLESYNALCLKQELLHEEIDIKPDIISSLHSETMLEAVRNIHSAEKPFVCNVCGCKFPLKAYLRKHMVTHTGEKFFVCNICGYMCTVKASLQVHVRTHTGEKPFVCNICGYKCTQKTNLKIHIRTHTGGKPFVCNICGYRLTQKSHLKEHMRIHTVEKPFVCNICGYKCTVKTNLKIHMRTHTGEKPFVCTTCGHKCTQKTNLKIHMRTHTGETPFVCNICGYKCIQKKNLNKHMRAHTVEKPSNAI